jgi:hypothetical protein
MIKGTSAANFNKLNNYNIMENSVHQTEKRMRYNGMAHGILLRSHYNSALQHVRRGSYHPGSAHIAFLTHRNYIWNFPFKYNVRKWMSRITEWNLHLAKRNKFSVSVEIKRAIFNLHESIQIRIKFWDGTYSVIAVGYTPTRQSSNRVPALDNALQILALSQCSADTHDFSFSIDTVSLR